MTVDFPSNCAHCGWQLQPPAVWLLVATLLDTHPSKTPGLDQARAVVGAELARARLGESALSNTQEPRLVTRDLPSQGDKMHAQIHIGAEDKSAPGSAGNTTEGLTTGSSPALTQEVPNG